MDQNLDQIQHLLTTFDEREAQYTSYTREIATILSPGVLTALMELLNLPNEAVVWKDFQLANFVLLVTALITYTPGPDKTEFLKLICGSDKDVQNVQVQRSVQLSIALSDVFQSKEIVKSHLFEMAKASGTVEKQQTKFDTATLTDEQLQLLLYARMTSKDTLQ